MSMRSTLGGALVAAGLAILTLPGAGHAFEPSKPECIAPAKPGGGFDITCRIAASGLEAVGALKTPMEVTFMPGGIGAVAYNHMNSVRAADPNVIVAYSTGSLLNLAQGKFGAGLDADDARWVATAGADYGAVIVRADSPYKTLDELMAAFKQDPLQLVIGAGGSVGSQDWMKAALLLEAIGVKPNKMRYVAFEGGGESKVALLGGHIHVYTGDVSEMKGELESGNMRILAILSAERLPPPFADIPTAKEQGYDIEWPIIRGFYMGKDAPDEAYDWWVAQFEKAYASPEFNKIREDKGLFKFDLAGAKLQDYVQTKVAEFRELARESGLIE